MKLHSSCCKKWKSLKHSAFPLVSAFLCRVFAEFRPLFDLFLFMHHSATQIHQEPAEDVMTQNLLFSLGDSQFRCEADTKQVIETWEGGLEERSRLS